MSSEPSDHPIGGGGERWTLRELRHELRTPINHILGYTEILLDEAGDAGLAEVTEDLERVHGAGRELLTVVNTLLDPAKHPGGRVDVVAACHQLRTPLDQVIGYAEMLLEGAEANGQGELVPDLRHVHDAAHHLLAVVSSVLAPEGVALGTIDDLLREGGRGIGTREVSVPATGEFSETPALHGRVLVVDDVAMNRDILLRRLEGLGCTAAAAVNGRQALDMLGTEDFDLILLDLMMPEVDGYEVLKRLRSSETWSSIPVIVLSALEEVEGAVRCIQLGAEDYLPKPFNLVLLKARVHAALEKKHLRDRDALHLQQIEQEKQRVDALLHVILPHEVAEELKATNDVQTRQYDHVAVLFCDVVGFTSFCDSHGAEEVVSVLQDLVATYEALCLKHDVLKIKTIGDAFMAVCGMLTPAENPVLNCIRCAVEMIDAAHRLPADWDVRIGIHVGPVVGGVLGKRQFQFDLWGDTVNSAARMEHNGEPGKITLSGAAWEQVASLCRGHDRGLIQVKGKGMMRAVRFEEFLEP